ncbi:hypothetical protein BRARA_C00234 [Brassica rapa]|uniref:Uncharacterized protein n=1 Tax=Brassica campestris TaxID=3711 RepID=A0A397ZR11_BRACM|nr:hypothetical protein BRARA_C00234 [Brassica rapa]
MMYMKNINRSKNLESMLFASLCQEPKFSDHCSSSRALSSKSIGFYMTILLSFNHFFFFTLSSIIVPILEHLCKLHPFLVLHLVAQVPQLLGV